jgi:hypothetical protein
MLALGCESGPSPVEAGSDSGWHASEPEAAPAEVRPLVDLLKRIQEGLYRKRRAETFWDERICYFDRVWDEAGKHLLAGYLPGDPRLDLQWRGVEFFHSGEFARCEVREIDRPKPGRSPRPQDVNWTGTCLFRKLAGEWRLSGPFLGAPQQGSRPWNQILLHEVEFMDRRSQSSRQAGQPVPEWASDSETIRVLGEGLSLYEERRVFPLLDMMMFLHSDNFAIRRYAHGRISRTFGVDYGFSEELQKAPGTDKVGWLKPWQDWCRRSYPKGYEAVPWP